MPLVSVAVITYNMERYLPTLLDSILKQRVNFDYEIVISDDFSPDNSRKIISEYKEKYPDIIKPLFKSQNVGGSRNMFNVLNACEGKYIAILEGDDFWEDENKLQYQVDFLEKNHQYIGMCCNSWCEHGEVPTYSDLMRQRETPMVYSFKNFQNRHFHDRLPSSTDTWVFKNIFKMYPDEDFSLFYKAHDMVWDQSLILILYGKGDIYADSKVVSHHRSITKEDGTNYQSLITQKNVLYEDSKMYEMMEEYIQSHLKRECGLFSLSRGDTWIDAKFRAMKSGKKEDKEIEKKIWRDQNNKRMLMQLYRKKIENIILRKMKIID